MANRVDRVRNSRPCNLGCRDCEAGIFSNRQAHHLKPISRRRPGSSCLVRWNRRRNEKNAVEIKAFSDLLRAAQMAPMDRIKGAAEEPDPHRNSISPFPEPSKKSLEAKPTRISQAQSCRFVTSKRDSSQAGQTSGFMVDHSRICPSPNTTNLVVVSSSKPIGPKA